jgi:hypothetical protein
MYIGGQDGFTMKDQATRFMAAGDRCRARIPIAPEKRASVEIQLEGWRQRLPLLDISEDGLCFECPDGIPPIAPGSSFGDVVVRLGGREMRGSLVIRHVTSSLSAGTQCGARFHPAGEEDRKSLSGLVNRAETQPPATIPHDRPAAPAPATDAKPPRCPRCLADVGNDTWIEGSICPYCLQRVESPG